MAKKKKKSENTIADNRKARFNYEITEKYEAGIALTGSEVKSLREGGCSLQYAHVMVVDGNALLRGAHIAEYSHGNQNNHEPGRDRQLLLHTREIRNLAEATDQKGLTIVPLRMYFTKRGFVKIQLGVGRGKKAHDKRESIKQKDMARQAEREMRDY